MDAVTLSKECFCCYGLFCPGNWYKVYWEKAVFCWYSSIGRLVKQDRGKEVLVDTFPECRPANLPVCRAAAGRGSAARLPGLFMGTVWESGFSISQHFLPYMQSHGSAAPREHRESYSGTPPAPAPYLLRGPCPQAGMQGCSPSRNC